MYLLGRGVRPDFTNAEEVEEWAQGMGQISTKKILSFLLNVIDFPASIASHMRERLAKPE